MPPRTQKLNYFFQHCKVVVTIFLLQIKEPSIREGVARGHRGQRQASGRRLQEGGLECECKDQFQKLPKGKFMALAVLGSPKKQCPCDHFMSNMKKNRHRRHHRKSNKYFRACQQFLQQCQLASLALPF
ncbi:C-X-C motif chemokine 17 [Echinops telfairi]|uniref:C-X-C motif chemokine 17 n=1 Tax=Echinops telfairi TaxID=9371 RepID=A0ABM0IYA1_ECHTE|nr:C-X-C motif chemokine 17 [Echinops telfairi]